MVRGVVGWSLRYRLLVLGAAAAMMLFGSMQLSRAPVDALPEFTPPYVEVQTEALGLSAEEVEQLITVPLEADLLHGVAWLDEIRSQSMPGLSSIVLVFEPGTDVIRARQMVAERLTQAHALPNVSKPPVMLQPLASSSRVLMVALSSEDVSLIDMSVLARWTIRPLLLGVPGVANVSIWGQRDRQLQVLVDPRRLRQERVSLQLVIETVGNSLWVSPLTFIEAATPGTGGFIDTPNQRLGIQHRLPIRGPEDMARIPIEEKPGVVLGDVATIVEDHQPLIGDAVVDDGSGLFLVIEKFPDSNTLEVTRGIEDALTALQPGLTGITVDTTVFRPASFIESATGNLALAIVIGFLLVALLLGLLLDWRAAVLSVVTLPLSLAGAGLVLYVLGATINAMTVAGLVLAIGIIVDDIVIGADSVVRRFRQRRNEDMTRSRAEIIVDAIAEDRSASVYGNIIIVLVVLPAAFVAGTAAAFLPEVALAYVLAVIVSGIVALTVAPALLWLLVTRSPEDGRPLSPLGVRLTAGYEVLLSGVARHARAIVAGAAAIALGIVLVAAWTVPDLGRSPLPQFHERDFLVRWEGPPSTSRTEMNRILARAGAELRAVPGVRSVGGQVGRAITADRVVNTNAGELWVGMDPEADYRSTLAAVEEVVGGYPGLGHSVVTYSAERIEAVLADTDRDFVVRIYGQDLAVLKTKAEEVRQALSEISGVVDPVVEGVADEPTIEIEVDLAAAESHRLKPGDIRRAATSLLSGIEVGFLFEEQKVFEVVVWGGPELRHSPSGVGDLLLDTPSGVPVRLAEVADVRIAPAPTVIDREGVMRVLDVSMYVQGRDQAAVMSDVQSSLAAIEFPLEYHAEVRDVSAERQADQQRLLLAIAAAAIGVFLLLQAALSSWRLAAMLFATLPAALLGGMLAAFAVGGASLSLGALGGYALVLGIAVRNGIMLVVHCQRLQRGTDESDPLTIIQRGAHDRLEPVVLTAMSTAAAMAPFALLGDLAGLEIVRPMAAVVVGGLATSTLLTLVVVPAVYLLAGSSAEAAPIAKPIEHPAVHPA